MIEPQLFPGAPAVMHLQATYVVPEGWHLTVVMRRDGEHWDDAYRVTYSHLSSPELLDVVCEESAHLLG